MVEASEEKIDRSKEDPEMKEESNGTEAEAAENVDWTELMGENIQMRVLGSATDDSNAKECRPQDAVVIDFVGRLAPTREDEDGPIFQEGKDWLIVIGDKYVSPGLEMGVRFMKDQQQAVIWSHSKFAHGISTRKHDDGYELPPESNVRYEVTVKSIICPDEETSDADAFQLRLAKSKKLIANDMFKNELYKSVINQSTSEQRAIRLYSKAADEMVHMLQTHQAEKQKLGDDYIEPEGQKEKTESALEIMLDCLNNIVAVYLKSKKYHEAKEAAVKVLTHDSQNYKALLRAARAAMMDPSGTYEEADAAIAAAEKVVAERDDLDEKEVHKLRQELKQKKQEYKKRRKEMMARMTKDLTPKETKKQADDNDGDNKQQSLAVPDEPKGMETEEEEAKGSDEPDVPMWRRLLPYAFQIIFPFIMWHFVVKTRVQQAFPEQDQIQEEELGNDEF